MQYFRRCCSRPLATAISVWMVRFTETSFYYTVDMSCSVFCPTWWLSKPACPAMGVGTAGRAGALRFLFWVFGDMLGKFMTDWDWPRVLDWSSTQEITDAVDSACWWWSEGNIRSKWGKDYQTVNNEVRQQDMRTDWNVVEELLLIEQVEHTYYLVKRLVWGVTALRPTLTYWTLTELHKNSINALYTEKEGLDLTCTDICDNTPPPPPHLGELRARMRFHKLVASVKKQWNGKFAFSSSDQRGPKVFLKI